MKSRASARIDHHFIVDGKHVSSLGYEKDVKMEPGFDICSKAGDGVAVRYKPEGAVMLRYVLRCDPGSTEPAYLGSFAVDVDGEMHTLSKENPMSLQFKRNGRDSEDIKIKVETESSSDSIVISESMSKLYAVGDWIAEKISKKK